MHSTVDQACLCAILSGIVLPRVMPMRAVHKLHVKKEDHIELAVSLHVLATTLPAYPTL